jgi:photosystem II stability/assembly factor-like uncharacterized protein
MKTTLTLTTLLLFFVSLFAQNLVPPTSSDARMQKMAQRAALAKNSIAGNIPLTPIGPSIFSSRVVDVDANPRDPSIFYVGYASSGLWKTENNGASFKPLFDNEAVMTIGDIAVNWDKNIIWIGSGENNSSRSSYSGVGMYRSEDGGKTWQHRGLEETHHIGRIALHPTNPDVVWVAALGHLYSPNKERGLFKTADGGKTWKQTLFVNENAGGIDILVDATDPNTLYAATWQRSRRAWNFIESGEGSGIWKSTDAGETWKLISDAQSGFPTGDTAGRIGLSIHQSTVFAVIDNNALRPESDLPKKKEDYTKETFRNISKADFLKLDKTKLDTYLKEKGISDKYDAGKVIDLVKIDKIKPNALTEFVEDANSLLFDRPVTGAQVYRSDDKGVSWKKTHDGYIDDLFYSYGYYFAQVSVSPIHPNQLFIMGVPILRSDDGGKNWISVASENVHSDHHSLWFNPNRAGHIINGNDGGINISYDSGENWIKCNSPLVGQFYAVNVDMSEPYNVYGGAQDNGVWTGAHNSDLTTSWHAEGQYPYKELMGGDGMQIMIDNRDNNTIYTGYQFGNYFRIDKKTGKAKPIQPKNELTERPLRFNWQTPIWLSVHNQDILYMGSNKVHRSMNKGDTFTNLSNDLTKGGQKGDVAFGTLTALHESPLKFGMLYTGSDDGLIHVSKDGGVNWSKISNNLPQNLWVSRLIASAHDTNTVYTALNGYRWDDFTPYLYVSDNNGATWQKIGTDLPNEPINVVKEDPKNKAILYVGTDHGVYVSLNRGKSFMKFGKDFPAVPVHDLVIHPRENDIIIGTHGRALYKGYVGDLQKTAAYIDKTMYVFELPKVKYNANWGKSYSKWAKKQPPSIKIPIYIKESGDVTIYVKADNGVLINQFKQNLPAGLNYVEYQLTHNAPLVGMSNKGKTDKDKTYLEKSDDGNIYLRAGKYVIEVEKGKDKVVQPLNVEEEMKK